ncbi:altered inheritance rate of mitochondria protein 25 isoform X1 [Cynara cardunculus var. scolymus]|uniref:Phospholipid scramblase n=2 Tax=Cynara cardunculus var. scolymus TaxID=59895 RepID=A0A118K2R3_CYNCS|nr:altered inheritance rate of mitochondria protein 25 isoform X1 [Cynara cardunculus var. scolymus]KVI04772.1 Scramblase [Cynara cardunculus var. scolymus]
MNWNKNLQRVTRLPKVIRAITKGSSPNNQQNAVLADKFLSFKKAGLAKGDIALGENLVSERKLYWRSYGLYVSGASSCWPKKDPVNLPWNFEHAIHNDSNLNRDFLVQLWVADGKMKKTLERRKQNFVEHTSKDKAIFGSKRLVGSYFSGGSITTNGPYDSRQSATEPLESASPEEAWIAPLLSRSNLLITRDIEWANLTLGFEQENRYAIVDVSNPHEPAGFIREQSNVIFRQLLRSRRPFVASITDGNGNELFRVRRPFWWITSSIYAEIGGKEIGVVHRRWHLWRRIYDLYLGDEQFAVVENPGLWNWTFTLKGINGEVLAEIDRDWRGFGFEVLTDAGQYVIRFDHDRMPGLSEKVQEFHVARPLTLSERAVTVALAVSLDNDYFSRHGGWGLPFIAVAE